MKRFAIYGCISVALLGLFAVGWIYRATQQVPEAYEKTLHVDPVVQRQLSTEMFNRSQRLVQQTKEPGEFRAAFTAEQINGYLAVDLEKQFAGLLPGEVRDPRVVVGERTVTLYCRYEDSRVRTIVSLELEPFISAPDVVGLRLVDVRAGALPLPIGRVQRLLDQAATHTELQMRWVEEDGLPVGLLTLPARNGRRVELVKLSLVEGEVRLAGKTRAGSSKR